MVSSRAKAVVDGVADAGLGAVGVGAGAKAEVDGGLDAGAGVASVKAVVEAGAEVDDEADA